MTHNRAHLTKIVACCDMKFSKILSEFKHFCTKFNDLLHSESNRDKYCCMTIVWQFPDTPQGLSPSYTQALHMRI